MKFLIISLCLFTLSIAYGQNEDCINYGKFKSFKTDSLLMDGRNSKVNPIVRIIDYGILPVRNDTMLIRNYSGSSRVYSVNNQIIKLRYQDIEIEKIDDDLVQTITKINVYYENNYPIYLRLEIEIYMDESRKLITTYDICYYKYEKNLKMGISNANEIIKKMNQLIYDASK